MSQQSFINFESPAVPDTRSAAAAAIAPLTGAMLHQVMNYIAGRGEYGATDEEIATALSMNQSTERPRRVDLFKRGHVRDSGRRRKTQSGREAIVWWATGKPLSN